MITVDQLDKFVLRKYAEKYVDSINETLEKFNINTPPRIRHFLAQILHESGNLVYSEEIASGSAYEGRKDLGNIVKGDGVKYKGRGLVQVTGRANYAAISKDLGVDFIKEPGLLATSKYAALSAGWFWDKKNLSFYADFADDAKLTHNKVKELSPIQVITYKINGGQNGIEDRIKNYYLAKTFIK